VRVMRRGRNKLSHVNYNEQFNWVLFAKTIITRFKRRYQPYSAVFGFFIFLFDNSMSLGDNYVEIKNRLKKKKINSKASSLRFR